MTSADFVVNSLQWGDHPFPRDPIYAWTLGPLVLWGRGTFDELWLAHSHRADYHVKTFTPGGGELDERQTLPEPPGFTDKAWSRWVFQGIPDTVHFKPAFPNLPVVVKPEYPFRIIPNAKARIFVRVPIWVQIQVGGQLVTEIPTAVLSNTWFGDPMGGELCYWISSSARREAVSDPKRLYQAICPIWIVNAAAEDLFVEKICLRVPSLTLFEHKGQLWSDETTVRFRGHEPGSMIFPSGQAPEQAPDATRINEPRSPITKNIAARTFESLREFKGLGFLSG